ncbi:hypothetical protein KEM54_002500 [Ascosphaera aggregata]|nr:hypothetical protein KEM54_002500 [Ascosphaera aggregata]
MRFFARFETYFAERPGVADTVAQGISAYQFRSRQIQRHQKKIDSDDKVAIEFQNLSKERPAAAAPIGEAGFVPKARPFDFERLARFMAWGFIMAPLQLGWYAFLKRLFPVYGDATTGPALKRVACDQFIFTPISECSNLRFGDKIAKQHLADQISLPTGLVGFFSFLTFAEGMGTDALKEKLRDIYVPTLKANYMLWPIVQVVNFRMIPTPYQIPFVSTIGIGWTAYLSLTNSKEDEEL